MVDALTGPDRLHTFQGDTSIGGHMSTTTSTIPVADEHDATRAFLADRLIADGYRVMTAPERANAYALLSTAHSDLILVSIGCSTGPVSGRYSPS
jgi:response regulator RpfG family c-di-GMP phosphodiesterase